MSEDPAEIGRSLLPHDGLATREVLERCAEMTVALQEAAPIHRPAQFWLELMAENQSMLRAVGVENFKRSLSQNYFNFPVEGPADPQMHALIKAWAAYPDSTPLAVELVGPPELGGIRGTKFLRSPVAARSYALFVGLLWLHATRDDPDKQTSKLEEPAVGNPVPLELHGRRISQDLANSLREYRRLQPHLAPTPGQRPPILAEIGAGYGRLGYLARCMQPCRYWIFDIPPALALAEWYLTQTAPSAKIFRWRRFSSWNDVSAEIEEADIAILSIDQLSLVPDRSVRAFATVSVLHEFRPEQIPFYVSLMGQKTATAMYTKNHSTWHNDRDDFVFNSTILEPPTGWVTAFDRPDDVLQSFVEKLFLRDEK